jgi:very-short-patch-repair endonuclease
MLWQALRNRGLDGAKFRRQHRIQGFVVDFCCVEKRLVVEVDGPVHQDTRSADGERQAIIEGEGFTVLRIPASVAETDVDSALKRIRKALKSAPSAPLPRAGEGWRQPG